MELYHTTDSDGVSEINPDRARMRELLEDLHSDIDNRAPHPDVSLTHDASGWALTVYPSKIVTLENLDDSDEPPAYMTEVDQREALAMWVELSKGQVDQVRSRPWRQDKA